MVNRSWQKEEEEEEELRDRFPFSQIDNPRKSKTTTTKLRQGTKPAQVKGRNVSGNIRNI
jgi:hypothetical protein